MSSAILAKLTERTTMANSHIVGKLIVLLGAACLLFNLKFIVSCANADEAKRTASTRNEKSIPQGFPVPIYPGATVVSALSSNPTAGESQAEAQWLTLTTPDEPAEVSKYYGHQLLEKYEWDSMNDSGDCALYRVRQKTFDAAVMISSGSHIKTRIDIYLGKEPSALASHWAKTSDSGSAN